MTIISAKKHCLDLGQKTHIMGIVNATPDSFSDGGKYNRIEEAIRRVDQMIKDGVDIVDIGGESTRPGATPVDEEEELDRVIPVVEAIASRFDVPISIDTYKAKVAEQAIQAGAHLINDVWGAKADNYMAEVAKQTDAPIILMHNRKNMTYSSLIDDVIADINESINLVEQAGVQKNKIIIDPGIGFAKTYEHNLEMMRQLDVFVALGYPVLLGTSRKSLIAKTLELPVDERVEGTIATVCYGIAKGCHIVRVHDVKEVSRAVKMMDAMVKVR